MPPAASSSESVDPTKLTKEDVLARIGRSESERADEVLATSLEEPAAVTTLILELASKLHGKGRVLKLWFEVGGQFEGPGRGKKRRPLSGLQLRRLISRLPATAEEVSS